MTGEEEEGNNPNVEGKEEDEEEEEEEGNQTEDGSPQRLRKTKKVNQSEKTQRIQVIRCMGFGTMHPREGINDGYIM